MDAVNNAKVLQGNNIVQIGDILQFHNNFQVFVSQQSCFFSPEELNLPNSLYNYWIIPITPNPYNGIYGYFRGLNPANANLLHDHSYSQQKLLQHLTLLDDIILIKPTKNNNKTREIKEKLRLIKAQSTILDNQGLPINQQLRDDLNISDVEIFDNFGTVVKTCEKLEHIIGKTVLLSYSANNYDKIGNTIYCPVFTEDIIAIVD